MVKPVAHRILDGVAGISLVAPLDYADTVAVVKAARFVLTDSGGLQEEAPTLGKPVLVMRRETERPEGLDAGTLELIGTDRATIVAKVHALLHDSPIFLQMAHASNPYGDGHASERIVAFLLAALRGGVRPSEFARVA